MFVVNGKTASFPVYVSNVNKR